MVIFIFTLFFKNSNNQGARFKRKLLPDDDEVCDKRGLFHIHSSKQMSLSENRPFDWMRCLPGTSTLTGVYEERDSAERGYPTLEK